MNICCPTCFGMVESNGLEVFIHYELYISLIPLLRNTNRHLRGYFLTRNPIISHLQLDVWVLLVNS